MSTKIYNAYRINRDVVPNISQFLNILQQRAIDSVASNKSVLKVIHTMAFVRLLNRDDREGINDYLNGHIDLYISNYLKECENSQTRELYHVDIKLVCSVLMDENYWYLKFYPNTNWHHYFLEEIENSTIIEDYHYQNQGDPPEDIPLEEFKERGKVWDRLLIGSKRNLRRAMSYVIFDGYEFTQLLCKNYYQGVNEEDLYNHLAYKFDEDLN